jgi:hypothetical protein
MMKTSSQGGEIPPSVLNTLNEVRRRDCGARVWSGLLRGAAILLCAMLVAMTIDWLLVLHEEFWRWTLTLVALGCAIAGFGQGCLLPLLRSRSLTSVARDVDQAHPSLEERFATVAEFARCQDAPEIRGSEPLIKKVAQQAAAMSSTALAAGVVVPRSGLVAAKRFFLAAASALVLMFALDASRAKVLFQRFWAPGVEFSLTQVEAKSGDLLIGKGESANLEFVSKGKLTQSAKLFIRSKDGKTEVVPLNRTSATGADFVYTRNSIVDSFDYRARSGDGQTSWHHVTVAERPKISQVELRIVPPAYSHLPTVEEKDLPHELRALEGSRLEVSFQSDQPLARMQLKFSDGKTQTMTESQDHRYRFTTVLSNTIAFEPLLSNHHNLDNLEKPSCEIIVYPDEPPTVKMLSPTDEITARPDDKVKIDFEAKDDFGLARAELVVSVKGETNTTSVVISIPLKNEVGAKLVRKQVELDLAQFKLKQDQELSYVVRVTDTKENPSQSTPSAEAGPPNTNAVARSDSASKPSTGQSPAKPTEGANHTSSPNTNEIAQQSQNPKPAGGSKPSATTPSRRDSKGSQPPPNDMAMRTLDVAGQCSACQPMKILVDEWGRSFEGQMREKQELTIDPTLRLLDELLEKAQDLTDATLATGQSSAGLSHKEAAAVEAAQGDIHEADRTVSELTAKSHDTPYAFIGLQIQDVRDTHISPARQKLGMVTLEAARAKDDVTNLDQASFHIRRGRQMLADLTRTYESAKRDYKVADAMQRLKKMHQIFLEDTQAMLGSKKPALNPQDRKVAEVDDKFVEKLRKLLEQKKKIMAELADILANDPSLLRRFMALEQLQGTNLRDQMTLLAGRQKWLAGQVSQWIGSTDKDRSGLLSRFLAEQASAQNDVALLAAQMNENMTTWLPLDVPPDEEPIVACRNLTADISRLATDASKQTNQKSPSPSPAAASQALEQLRVLYRRLPEIGEIKEPSQKLAAFVANRMTEAADLVTRQSGWIKKSEALETGDYPQAAEIEQHRLTVDTTTLGEKMDSAAAVFGSISAEIKNKANELNQTVQQQILTEQADAIEALSRKEIKEAAGHQEEATKAFAKAEKQFDELLRLIIAKLDAAPPPTDPGQGKSLEGILAMLEDEKKAAEGLGIPCRPINVSILKDWVKPGSCSNPQQARSQTLASQAQDREAAKKTQRLSDQVDKKLALQRGPQLAAKTTGPLTGPKRPTTSWNTVVSQLGDEIRQGRENVPPEQYRQAIEQYFERISEKAPMEAASTIRQ